MEQIGKRLRALREGVRLTQVNMAEILGVQQSRINRYETGQSTPSPEVFVKYADYFDVSMDYLYCRTDKPQGKLYDYQPQALKAKTEQPTGATPMAFPSMPNSSSASATSRWMMPWGQPGQ